MKLVIVSSYKIIRLETLNFLAYLTTIETRWKERFDELGRKNFFKNVGFL